MKMIINGVDVDASDNATINVTNPFTGELVDTIPNASADDVNRACEIGLQGQREWGATSLDERIAVLNLWVELLEKHKEELGNLLCDEMGKPLPDAIGEIGAGQNWAHLTALHARTILGGTFPSSESGHGTSLTFTTREPRGLCLAICPTNFPISGMSLNVTPAMLGGNAVIIKPATGNPLAAIRATRLLVEAGMPAAACQVITGSGSRIGNSLAEHPAVSSVMMIGSAGVGAQIASGVSANMAHVTLELGGNDCMVMLDDADMDLCVDQAIEGRMYNAGQICCAPKRLLIPRSRKEEFSAKLLARLSSEIKVGDPREKGTRISTLPIESAAVQVEGQIIHAVDQGAEVVYGGKRDGAIIEPTVIDKVTPDMDVAQNDEIFGPVFAMIEYDTEDEALEIANNNLYGLMSQVMTEDYRRGIRFANRMESGAVIVNYNTFSGRSSAQPFGGYKKSGIGRNGISTAIQELTQEKSIILNGFFGR